MLFKIQLKTQIYFYTIRRNIKSIRSGRYHFISLVTGEIAFSPKQVFHIIRSDLFKHHFFNLIWKIEIF